MLIYLLIGFLAYQLFPAIAWIASVLLLRRNALLGAILILTTTFLFASWTTRFWGLQGVPWLWRGFDGEWTDLVISSVLLVLVLAIHQAYRRGDANKTI